VAYSTDHIDTDKIPREQSDCFYAHTNVIKITIPKTVDTSKDELLLGGGIRHITATLQCHAHRKQVPAYISNFTGCAVAPAQHCVNGDRPSQWEMANFDPSQNRNP